MQQTFLAVLSGGCLLIAILIVNYYQIKLEKDMETYLTQTRERHSQKDLETNCMDLQHFNQTFGNFHMITFNIFNCRAAILTHYLLNSSENEFLVGLQDKVIGVDGFNIYVLEWFPSSIQMPRFYAMEYIRDSIFEYDFIPDGLSRKVGLQQLLSYSEISLLENSTICCPNCNKDYRGPFKTDFMRLGPELSLTNMYNYTEEFLMEYPFFIRYVKNTSDLVKKNAVEQDPTLLRFIANQTQEIKTIALDQTPFVLKFIHNQTESDIFNAIQNNPRTLQYVHHQTDEFVQMALEKDGMALCDVRLNQTSKMIKLALQENPDAIRCVRARDLLSLL